MSRDNMSNIWGPSKRRQYHGSYGVNDVAPWVGDIEEFREPVEDMRNGVNQPFYGGDDDLPQEGGGVMPGSRYDFGKYGKFRLGDDDRVNPQEWRDSLGENTKSLFDEAFREATGYDFGAWQAMLERGYSTDISLGQVTDITRRMTNPSYGGLEEKQTSIESGRIPSWEEVMHSEGSFSLSIVPPVKPAVSSNLSPDEIRDSLISQGYRVPSQVTPDNVNSPNRNSPIKIEPVHYQASPMQSVSDWNTYDFNFRDSSQPQTSREFAALYGIESVASQAALRQGNTLDTYGSFRAVLPIEATIIPDYSRKVEYISRMEELVKEASPEFYSGGVEYEGMYKWVQEYGSGLPPSWGSYYGDSVINP
jgi:hypothetical protein